MEPSQETATNKRAQSLYEKMHDMGTNLLFSVGAWSLKSTYSSSLISHKEEEIIFQGTPFNKNGRISHEKEKELLEKFKKIIWITYRRNFPALLQELSFVEQKANYVSDTGWGCMVRVGQMAFAEGLRRHLSETQNLEYCEKQQMKSIIEGFLDEDEQSADLAPYSIQKIAKLAFAEFQLKPGDWYTPNRICYVLGILHNEKKCLPGTENLKVALFTSSQPVVFEDFLDAMCIEDKLRGKHSHLCGPECRNIEHQNESNERTTSEQKMRLVCPVHHELANSLLVYIVCLIGVDTPDKDYLDLTIKMMDFKHSLGIMGGKPKKALYFLGRVGSDFIYLDPHYVQDSSNSRNINEPAQLETYFCNKFQTLPSSKIDSSFSLMFYLKDLSALEEFYQFMMGLKEQYNDKFFIMLEDSDPYSAQGEAHFSSNIISTKNLDNKSVIRSQPQNERSQMNDGHGNKTNDTGEEDDFEVI